ncbi:MAG: hypothetical protein KDB25_09850 [Leucobacter sp.]|nr:hypothetical protein [Leucobacter sp.]
MEKKRPSETGISIDLPEGTHEAWAIDAVVDDLLHGDTRGVLKELHEPHESHEPHADEKPETPSDEA